MIGSLDRVLISCGAYQVCTTTTPSVWRAENRTSMESYGGARIAPHLTFALCATLTTNTIYVISFCVSSFQGIPGRSGSFSVTRLLFMT